MDSFAQGINIYKLVWVFVIGCVLGYMAEMLWCYLKHGYFESRKGVIYGPISPVYGFGAVLLTLTLNPIAETNGVFIFLACAVIGALFEYICSLFQEKVLEQYLGNTAIHLLISMEELMHPLQYAGDS